MTQQLPTLIINVETRALALKTALDDFVGWLNNLRTDIANCEAELAEKQRIADTQLAHLRAEIQQLRSDRAKEEQAYKEVRQRIEKERKEIGREKERFLKSLDLGPTAA